MRAFPKLKRSALNWSLWLLAKDGHVSKMRVRVNGKLTTVYGAHEAVDALRARMGLPEQTEAEADAADREGLAPVPQGS